MSHKATAQQREYFGACPVCGCYDAYLNIYKAHWFYCDTHRVKWCIGWNLFSGWRYEDEAVWQENADYLADYRDVSDEPDDALERRSATLDSTSAAPLSTATDVVVRLTRIDVVPGNDDDLRRFFAGLDGEQDAPSELPIE